MLESIAGRHQTHDSLPAPIGAIGGGDLRLGVAFPREQLFRRISRNPLHPFDRSLDMQVRRLGRKLEIQHNWGNDHTAIRSTAYVFAGHGNL
jgi:hypothetical protein